MKFRLLTVGVLLSLAVFAQQQFTLEPQQVSFNNQRFDLGKQNILGLVKQQLYAHIYDINLGPEGYHLIVDSTHATLNATSPTGLFYGIQTVKQLVKFDSTTQRYYIPGCTITDYPQYSYRGMHLDVCRHFFSKEVVKQYIDTLSKYRINYFHWHLTDDQGWRIEIKKYPKLTEVGAWRTEKDGSRYSGYYTQADVKEMVQYAAERHVTIIPEIEMPGHSSAAIAAYPWLSCHAENITVPNRWGIFKDIYCPTDSTFQFLRDVLDEVCALFPGPYVHIGGDEVPKDQWKKSPVVKNLMQREILKNYEQVQHYFMRTMEQYLLTKGKRSMGWGEVTRGGMSDSMVIMSWRGKFAGIKAAKKGQDVVMASRFYCYFDYPQTWKEKKAAWWMTRTTVEKVSNFNPKSAQLNEAQNKKILGAEATLWTEYIADEKQLWYQLQPRLKVFSGVLWGGKP